MGRDIRYLPAPGALVEVTVRTLQSRYLLRPSPRLNQLVIGVLARSQAATGLRVHAAGVMSNHFHLLVSPTTTRQLADFMRRVNGNLSVSPRRSPSCTTRLVPSGSPRKEIENGSLG